jgi:hypothetical protein
MQRPPCVAVCLCAKQVDKDLNSMLERFNNHDELRTAYIAAITAIDIYFLDLQAKI